MTQALKLKYLYTIFINISCYFLQKEAIPLPAHQPNPSPHRQ